MIGREQLLLLDLLKLTLARVEPELGLGFLRSLRERLSTSEDLQVSSAVGAIRHRLDFLPPRAKMQLWLLLRYLPEASSWRQQLRLVGRDLPNEAETMVGLARLQNVEDLGLDVIARSIPGDFVEAGVWRGGSGILMRAVQIVAGETERKVWLADSFQGLPPPDSGTPQDKGSPFHRVKSLAVSRAEVERRFGRYGLLDHGVRFVEGWFSESLPGSGIGPIALLRIDADMYRSTMDALEHLYHRVAPGGFVIIDDYGAIPECRSAVDDFRRAQEISAPIVAVDFTGVFWQVS